MAAADHSALDLLDRKLLGLNLETIRGVHGSSGTAKYTLQKDKNEWRFTDSPAPAFVADPQSVGETLRSFADLHAAAVRGLRRQGEPRGIRSRQAGRDDCGHGPAGRRRGQAGRAHAAPGQAGRRGQEGTLRQARQDTRRRGARRQHGQRPRPDAPRFREPVGAEVRPGPGDGPHAQGRSRRAGPGQGRRRVEDRQAGRPPRGRPDAPAASGPVGRPPRRPRRRLPRRRRQAVRPRRPGRRRDHSRDRERQAGRARPGDRQGR